MLHLNDSYLSSEMLTRVSNKCSENYVWLGLQYYIFQASSWLQVIKTSTDPYHKFSAPFKAGNSRQAQTCNILQKYNTKEIQLFNWFNLDRRNVHSIDLEPQSFDVAMLAA